MKQRNKILFYIAAVISSLCIVCMVAGLAINLSETKTDYMSEYGGNPEVYSRIASMTDCAALQNEFDQAEQNLALQEPGTPEYRWGLGYMKASDDRMREIGCYESKEMPIQEIIANTAHAAQEQTRAAQPPTVLVTLMFTSTLAPVIIPIEPTSTIFIFELQTKVAQPTIYIYQTDTPFVLATSLPPSGGTCSCAGDLYNCTTDFSTQAQAQACFDYCVSQGFGDIHGLDGNDGDGKACESLP